jgi:hypothetical protein
MIIFWGHRFYGTVDKIDGVFVATRFAHLWFIPLIPVESYLVLGAGPSRPQGVALSVRLHRRSVTAGYLRIWSLIALFACWPLCDSAGLLVGLPAAALALAVALFAWLRMGRLSPREIQERTAYAQFADAPIDVGLLGVAATVNAKTRGKRGDLGTVNQARAWRKEIDRRAREALEHEGSNALASYRGTGRFAGYEAVAENPAGASPECRGAALTLARLAATRGDASSQERDLAARAHEKIGAAL